jgi:hypothetical protein
MAGTAAAINYLADLGAELGASFAGRRLQLKAAMGAIRAYERPLVGKLIAGLQAIPGVTLYGITMPARADHRHYAAGHHAAPGGRTVREGGHLCLGRQLLRACRHRAARRRGERRHGAGGDRPLQHRRRGRPAAGCGQ